MYILIIPRPRRWFMEILNVARYALNEDFILCYSS